MDTRLHRQITRRPAENDGEAPDDRRRRSIAETLTWRLLAELDTFAVSYLTTGSVAMSLSIVSLESASGGLSGPHVRR